MNTSQEKEKSIIKKGSKMMGEKTYKEQIMNNDVDVSECEFYLENDKYSCDLSFINKEELCNCNEIDDCYFKQLAHKTQECEELKEKLKFKIQENIKLSKENRNLKNWAHTKGVEIKVNRKIKETNLEEFCRLFQFKEIQARENKLKEWQDFENDLQWKFYENCKEWAEMRDSRDRYRKALEEIKVIAHKILRAYEQCEFGCDACDAKQILDIINKSKEKK